jgi:RNA polymerase sigma-70 factor (ECF subfamily)
MTSLAADLADAAGMADPVTDRVSEAYARDFRRLVGMAILLTGDRAAAEDVVHDAFEVAIRRATADPTCVDAAVTPWLRGIVARVVRQRRRGLVREMRRLVRVYQHPSDDAGLSDVSMDVVGALLRLPPRMRACAVLFYLEDRSTADIARDLDCAPRTVETNLRAARERLRRELADHLENMPSSGSEGGPSDV